jgi:hypothetical protein
MDLQEQPDLKVHPVQLVLRVHPVHRVPQALSVPQGLKVHPVQLVLRVHPVHRVPQDSRVHLDLLAPQV